MTRSSVNKKLRSAAIFAVLVTMLAVLGTATARDPDGASTTHGAAASIVSASAYAGDVRALPHGASAESAAAQWRADHPGQILPMPEVDERSNPPTPDQGQPGILPMPTPPTAAAVPAATFNFDGMGNVGAGNNVVPPDGSGVAGLNHYVQFLNSANGGVVGIWNKADGTKVTQFYFRDLWTNAAPGSPCDTASHSDPQIVYDDVNNRYILQDFTTSSPYYWAFAVSKTSDPVTGGWWLYCFSSNFGNSGLPDYQKMGIWPDGIYWGSQGGGVSGGAEAWVINKDQIESGASAQVQAIYMGTLKVQGVETIFRPAPSTFSTATGTPPAGAPNYFGTIYSAKVFRLFKFHVDWSNSALSTLTRVDVNLGSWSIEGSTVTSTANSLDTLREHLTQPSKYTNLGGVQSLWNHHGVANPSATTLGASEWFQITNPAGTPTVAQQSVWAPDTSLSRFQPGLGIDRSGNMLLEYSVTSSSVNPGIRYVGRTAGAAANTIDLTETTLVNGGGGFSANCGGTCTRWGDYTQVALDPYDGCTFWFEHEYMPATGLNWMTRIGAVKLSQCTPLSHAPTTTATLSGTSGTNGWYKSAVGATLTCTPAAGTTCTATNYKVDGGATQSGTGPITITGDSATHTLEYWSTGSDGAVETHNVQTIEIDATPPTASAPTLSPAPNANGWNNANVVATSTCTDATSGAVAASVSTTVSTEGANQAATTTCTDLAGNTATGSVSGINIDKTAPTLSGSRSPAANAQGWNNADVTASWTCTDALSGVGSVTGPATVSTEGASQSRTGTCTDLAGNSASNTVTGISIDKTAPTLAGSRSPAANANGWNNVNVVASWTCSDALSGVQTAPTSVTVSTEGASQSATGTCVDKAGNSGSNTVTGISIDKTAPTGVGSRSPAANAQGWNNADVTASATCSDALSGIPTQPASSVVSTEGAAQSRSFTCTDAAGNTASVSVTGISIDKTAPSVSNSQAPAANGAGWNNAAVTVSFGCTDALSGVQTAPSSVALSSEGSGQSATGACTDKAGNAASSTRSGINIDLTAPSLSGSRSPAANAQGWNNADVTVSFACSDALSGVSTSTGSQVVSTEGAGQSRSGSCTDVAGNSASATVSGISIDKTAPTVSASRSPAANANGWNNANVTASFACSDALSGVQTAPTSVTVSTEGASQSATGTCVDKAGNTGSASVTGINIDKTRPVLASHADVTAEATSASGATVSYANPSATDALSGAGSVSCAPASGGTFALGDTSVGCSASDLAGNSASSSFVIHVVDSAAPVIDAAADVTAEATSASGATVTYASPATHDAVDGAGVASCAPASGSTFPLGATTVTCTATDSNGNAATPRTFAVRVLDTTAPVIGAVSSVSAEATSASGATVNYAAPATTDAVDGNGVATCAPASGSVFALGATTVTCSATDAAGNAASSVSFIVTIVDTTAPTIAPASDVTAEATSASGATVTYAAPATQDAVDGSGVASCAPASGSVFALGATAVTCSATDAAGNGATRAFTVTILDTTAPTIAAASDVTAEATSASGATVSYAAPATTDAVDGDGVATCAPASGSVFALGATVVTCSATDAAGNAASPASFTVRVLDTTAPAIDAASDVTAEATGASGAVVSFASPATHDAVDGEGVAACAPASGSVFPLGSTSVTCTATDAAGNSASTTFVVRVNDASAPVIEPAADVTAEATSASGALVSFASPATHDAVDGDGVASCAPASGSVFALGATVVTCSATDAAGNAASPVSFTVRVVDTTAPTIDAASDVTAEATDASGAGVSFASPATHDAVDGDGVATCSPASGSVFTIGTTTVSCSATDAAGNAAVPTSFLVTVRDGAAPAIDAASDVTAEATSAAGATVTFASPATHDAVDGDGLATCAPASGSVFALGATTVTCTATDSNGNAASPVSFTVRVVDTTAPTIGAVGDHVAEATGANGAAVTFTTPDTHDAVDGDGSATCAPASGETFPLGSALVTCTATDAAGNTASRSFTVTVLDTTAPTIDAPSDVTAEATDASGARVSFASPPTHDAVDGDGVASCAPASGSVFALGATSVTCTVTDAAGNAASSVSFTVRVVDTTAPAVDAASDLAAEATSAAGAIVTFEAPASHDAVDGDGVATCAPASGSTFPSGATTVTCTATDAAGNAASTSFVVRIGDATAPTIDAVADVTAEATSASGATVDYAAPASHDAVDGDAVATCAPASGSTFALGATTVTCTATDGSGNSATRTFLVSVVDTTAPAIDATPDVTTEATGADGAIATFAAPATSDAVDGAGSATCAPASGGLFALGATTVTCAATDAAGNTATSQFVVRVVDTTAPTLSVPSSVTAEATSASGAVVAFDASASDAVSGDLAALCTPASGSRFALGATSVACSATDAAGNVGSATFTVSVVDTTAPTVDAASDVSAEATSGLGAVATFASPATHDAVDGDGVASCAPASGSTFALGETLVTCAATDAAGNTAAPTTFTVRVVDTTAPALALPDDLSAVATSASGAIVSFSASATDVVDGATIVACDPASGSTFARGETRVTCTTTDAAGNTASGSFVVRVVTQIQATVSTDRASYGQVDALVGGISGKVHVQFDGMGAGAEGANVCVTVTSSLPLIGAQTLCGETDANGDFAFSVDLPYEILGSYTLHANAEWRSITASADGGYTVGAVAANAANVASLASGASLLP